VKSSSTVVAIEQNDLLQLATTTTSKAATAVSTSGNGVNEILALKGKAATTVGSTTRAVTGPTTSGTTLYTDSFTTSAETFNLGDRLSLDITAPNDSTNCSATLWYDASTTASKLTVATLVPEGVAGLMLLAPALPLALRWWRRRPR
jgi:hypothetical protein